ncbi:transmembrane amino acid transporter protein-domain-containing protein [Dichotomopilus funicola]|uniref:Transmembrane amino acid transporter protein-domain-containing protein n=1 Tax=Dichotomopilus funicola TaxID=1934379 RepID=A0AAN6V7V5_9PEZI|nr:transmembrane amino acid transporter protein-domain-containing protein [Dichotomopilus funicola]
MSRIAALLLQLTLWAVTVHAFYPFVPNGHCGPDGLGKAEGKRGEDGSDAVTLDLVRKPSGRHAAAHFDPIAEALGRVTRKFGKPQASPTSELSKRKNTYSVSTPETPTISNSAGIYQYGPDYSYFIKVQVGSAQQPFYMLLDSGASNTWLMGSDCTSKACEMHDTFDPSSSTSWKSGDKGFLIQYGSGSLTGTIGHDTATLAGLKHDLSFGLANETTDDFTHFAFDGILGLAMSPSVTGAFLQTLKTAKVLDTLLVGLSLNRDSDGVNDGQVTFGGVDSTKYKGDITYHVVEPDHKTTGEWAIALGGTGFDGKTATIKSQTAYIDTGTSFIFAPPDDLAALFKLIPGSDSYQNGEYIEYSIPCDTTAPLHITFSGVDYEISSQDWVVQRDQNKCIANLYGYEVYSGTWLVGDTFLKNVYTVLDADKMRVGFASKPAPPPRPTTTTLGPISASAGVSVTADPAGITPPVGDNAGNPIMPGFSGQESQGPGSSQTAPGPGPAQTQTHVNGGHQVVGAGFYGFALGVAAAIAALVFFINSLDRPEPRRPDCVLPDRERRFASFRPRQLQLQYALSDALADGRIVMARATSHGAAAAANNSSSNSNNNNRRGNPSPSPLRGSNRSSSEEATGLLSPDPDSLDDAASSDHSHQKGGMNGSSRAHPRTPNRVRFDLRPTIVDDDDDRAANGDANTNGSTRHDNNDPDNLYPRESFDLDLNESDPLTSDPSLLQQQHGSSHNGQRGGRPLLTDIEAPSVTVATSSPFTSTSDAEAWHAAEQRRPKSSLPSAFMNMANSIIGAGIIGQPYAMREAGLLAGTVLLVLLTVVVDWTICLIVVNSKLSGASSFQGTVEKCFGRTGLVAISVAQWAFAFGGMVAFGVIVGDSIPPVLRAVWPGLDEMPVVGLLGDRRVVIVVFTLLVSYPLALYRDIAKLAKASTLALISMGIIVFTVLVQGMMVPAENRGVLKDWRMLVINDGIFQAIGVISFAFVCHHNSLLIYGSLEKPTIDRFSRVTHISTAVSMFACLIMALSGFLTFGDKTQGNVLNNFPADNTMVNVARLCFGLNMLTTLPLEAFVCREVMFNYYFPGEPFNMNLHLIFTSSLVFSAMVLSLWTCDLGTVFDLVGGTSAAAMAYILPPLCYIKLTTRSWKTYLAWAVVVFGTTVMVMSMLQAIAKMITGECLPAFIHDVRLCANRLLIGEGDTRQCY